MVANSDITDKTVLPADHRSPCGHGRPGTKSTVTQSLANWQQKLFRLKFADYYPQLAHNYFIASFTAQASRVRCIAGVGSLRHDGPE
jgi:hypothetical protein